jgi:spore germination cell wall hydrolase CwlJ-like protein
MKASRDAMSIARPNGAYRALMALAALIALALIAAALLANVNRSPKEYSFRPHAPAQIQSQAPGIAVPNLVRPITPEQAIEENQKREFDAPPDTPARPFVLRADSLSRERAINCLAQAAYYEAGAEGADGERAVAQVVLNRLRHPGFPSTVCGVVYQGSELPTGCQFTFTCDGSLVREPLGSAWKQARQIATAALAGKVFGGVGHATHYHADYVLPYWADTLAKQVQIGEHIFYRLKGRLGSSDGFSQRYGGSEPELPALEAQFNPLIQSADQATSLISPEVIGRSSLAADAPAMAFADTNKQQLLADQQKGTLIADQYSPQFHKTEVPKREDCSSAGGKQIRPAEPIDRRAGHTDILC